MRIACVKTFLLFAVAGAIVGLVSVAAVAQSATLFSRNKYPTQQRKNCITFVETNEVRKPPPGAPVELGTPIQSRNERCDVTYGSLWVNNELDGSKAPVPRKIAVLSKIWDHTPGQTEFMVPVVAPLPKLKPGEVRTVSISVDGADAPDLRISTMASQRSIRCLLKPSSVTCM